MSLGTQHQQQGNSTSSGNNSDTAGNGELDACCTCVCPPGQGFGRAFPAASQPGYESGGRCPRDVEEGFPHANNLCPYVGVVAQCTKEQVGTETCELYGQKLASRPCAMVPGQTKLATASCHMPLSDRGAAHGWGSCEWTTQPCEYNPYYPIDGDTDK